MKNLILLNRRGRRWPYWLTSLQAFLMAAVFAWLPVVVIADSISVSPLEWVFVGILAVASLLAVLIGVVHLLSWERIVIRDSRIEATRQIGPLCFRWSVPMSDITSIDVPSFGPNFRGYSSGCVGVSALIVRAQGREFRCCFGVPPSKADAVAAEMRRHAGAVEQ